MCNVLLSNIILRYILSSIFLVLGILSIRYSLKEQTIQNKLFKRNDIPTYGKGGRIHKFYLGSVLIGLALYLYWGNF